MSSTAAILRCRGRRRNVLFVFQFPYNQITKPNQERNQSERPRAAFPIVDGCEPYHQTEAHHGPYDPAPRIRAPAYASGGRSQQFCGNGLTFFHHHPDGPLPHSSRDHGKYANHHHDCHGCAKYGQKHNRYDGNGDEVAHFLKIGVFILVIALDDDAMLVPKFLLQLPVNFVSEIG